MTSIDHDADAPISHTTAKCLISKAWDEEITSQESQQLRRHLRSCARCARAAGNLRLFLVRLDAAICRPFR